MGAAAGKEAGPNHAQRVTWSDPVQEICIDSGSAYTTKKNSLSVEGKFMSAMQQANNVDSRSIRKVLSDNRRAVNTLSSDEVTDSRFEDNPVSRKWQVHKSCASSQNFWGSPTADKTSGYSKGISSFSRSTICGSSDTPRKRFEDIPVSSMWQERLDLPGFTDDDEATGMSRVARDRSRRTGEDTIEKGIEEIERNFREGQLASPRRPWSYRNQNVRAVGIGGKTLLTEPLTSGRMPLAKDRSVGLESPISQLPRTMSDPVSKPTNIQLQNRHSALAAANDSKQNGTSNLIARTYSDPVKNNSSAYQRPATPCVSSWLPNRRPLNDYIGQRRANECSGSKPPSSSGLERLWLGTIPDVEEPEKRPPAPTPRRNRRDTDFPSFFTF